MITLGSILSTRASKQKKKLVSEVEILRASPLLDPVWYRQSYADLTYTPVDVARHYIDYGAAEGRNPGPNFDTNFYLEQYPDVKLSGMNPLLHYILHGAASGRLPNPHYDPSSPLLTAPVAASAADGGDAPKTASVEPIASVEPEGGRASGGVSGDESIGQAISAYFDAAFYLGIYPDVANARMDPLRHFCANGWKEERDPTPWFSTSFYLKSNLDVKNANINPFWHYLTSGRGEGRIPKPTTDARLDFLKCIRPPIESDGEREAANEERVEQGFLADLLGKKFRDADGVVLSFSHSCYPRVTAGTELFIADEQKLFNEKRFVYLHFSPLTFSTLVKDTSPGATLTRVALDGDVVGVMSFAEAADALRIAKVTSLGTRLLIVHSLLGQSTPALLRILDVLEPSDAYYWVHDYSSLCTGYNLLRNSITYCHAPARNSVGCSVCVFESSRLENAKQLDLIFQVANFTVVSPSAAAMEIWQRASELPHKSAIVVGHCEVDKSAGKLRDRQIVEHVGNSRRPVKVAFVGFPVRHKGWPAFEQLVDETWADPAYEFFHFSYQSGPVPTRRIRQIDAVVSAEHRDAMVDLLKEHEIDIVTILAPWPETFSYVTFEALAAGCDIVTLADSGNVAAVVRQTGRGRVFLSDDEVLDFFTSHGAVELVRSRAEQPNPLGILKYCGTTAAIAFNNSH